MILLETGEAIDARTASVLLDRDEEMEAIARENGKYDAIPVDQPKRYHSESCHVAMERGSECYCGLVPFDESY